MAEPTGYFEVYYSNYQYRWRFKANNHEIIAHGESYHNKADCLNAIRLVKGSSNAPVKDA